MDSSDPKNLSPLPTGKVTPVRRLGLSRRSSPYTKTNSPSPLSHNNSSLTPTLVSSRTDFVPVTPLNLNKREEESTESNKSKIAELENKLHSVSNVTELEESIQLWKVGCKEALLALQKYFQANEKAVTLQELCTGLRILDVVKEHLEPDFINSNSQS